MDGNNQIVPIAYGLCRGETGDCWSWWMSVLKECIGDNPNLVFISDRHPAIALAVRNEFPSAFHGICCRHLMMNLSLKKKKYKGLYWSICKAYTPEEWQNKMDILQAVQPDAHRKLIEADPRRWSRAHCPRTRYNYCTSNSVESVNACTVKTRKLPVTMLMESYRKMVQKWYFNRRQAAANMKHDITDWAADKVEKRKRKSATWEVQGVNQYEYQVYDGLYNREVNFTNATCECRKWQLSGIPCGHVIAVTRSLGLTDCAQFVADWFKKEKYQATYAESIHFVGNFNEWEFPSHVHPVTPPQMDNPQPGRPKNTNRILSQGEDPKTVHCSRCKEAGHKKTHCKKSFVPEPPVNKRKQKNQEFPTNEQREAAPSYNTHQPYDHNLHGYNQYSSQSCGQNTYPWQPYGDNTYPSHQYNQNQHPYQNFSQNQYASQTYNQNLSQPYPTQPVQNDHQYPSQVYEQYDSQQYASQHLDDHHTQDSNSFFKSFGF